jgi:colicin import membrane protein
MNKLVVMLVCVVFTCTTMMAQGTMPKTMDAAKGMAKQASGEAKEKGKAKAEEAKEKGKAKAEEAKEKGSAKMEDMKDKAKEKGKAMGAEAGKVVGKTKSGKQVMMGPKGGLYYMNDKGEKTYVKEADVVK